LVPVICQSATHPAASSSLPMMASGLAVPSAGGASQGTTDIEVVGAGPRLGDDARNLLQDLVARTAGTGISGSAALGDAASALGVLGCRRSGGIWTVLIGFF
jgi:hypothetical protein